MCYLNTSHLKLKQKKIFLMFPTVDLYPGPPGEQPNAVTIEQFGPQL